MWRIFESLSARLNEFEEKSDHPTLTDYLENVSLVSDLDEMGEDGGAVTMMTLHSAKGLEFPNVFMVGMEENLFPSARSRDDEARMEEERRLCYVGITRARERLFCLTLRVVCCITRFNSTIVPGLLTISRRG